jgi:hypothetical protein
MWIASVSEGSVKADLRKETASLHVKNVLVFDAFTVPNSLDSFHPMGRVNAIINSLRIEWSGTTMTRSQTDCADGFRGDYFEDVATIEVTATTPPVAASSCPPVAARNGFQFVSEPGTTISHFAQIGRERNGVFFA